jgi:hypothetical protein
MYYTWESIDTDHRPQTTEDTLLHSLRVGSRNGGILKNYRPNLFVMCIFPDLSCLIRNIRTKFVGPLIFPAKVNRDRAG